MSSDKHFHPPAPVPDALEDHQPDDMFAARSIGIVLLACLVVCTIIAAIILGRGATVPYADPPASSNGTEQTS